MSHRYDNPQEAGRAWMRDELSSHDYFATARREAIYGKRLTRLWQRIPQWIKPGRGRR